VLAPGKRTIRIGVTGLARAGKTALLTSIAGNLLAEGAGYPALPSLRARLGNRTLQVTPARAGAESIPRFDVPRHLDSLANDPPLWPDRTDSTSLLALDLTISRSLPLPPRCFRVELLDYPGEWLLDLPLLHTSFQPWATATLNRLADRPEARSFLSFAEALPADAQDDERLANAGSRLYRDTLTALRNAGLSYLQPGRLLMPPPGPPLPWMTIFPLRGRGGLARLMSQRFQALQQAIQADLAKPLFARVDRLVILADLLAGLHAGPDAFADAQASLAAAAAAIGRQGWWSRYLSFRIGGLKRIAWAASKTDHVARHQRGNLARLLASLAPPAPGIRTEYVALAAMRCTEDFTWELDGRPVSAVKGHVTGSDRLVRSYPGEVPDTPPDERFWQHRFLALPDFTPARLPQDGRAGVPHLNLDKLLSFLLEDLL
jgi:uncharacterized protein